MNEISQCITGLWVNYIIPATVVSGRSGTKENPGLWIGSDHVWHCVVQNPPGHYPTVFLGGSIDPAAILYDSQAMEVHVIRPLSGINWGGHMRLNKHLWVV